MATNKPAAGGPRGEPTAGRPAWAHELDAKSAKRWAAGSSPSALGDIAQKATQEARLAGNKASPTNVGESRAAAAAHEAAAKAHEAAAAAHEKAGNANQARISSNAADEHRSNANYHERNAVDALGGAKSAAAAKASDKAFNLREEL